MISDPTITFRAPEALKAALRTLTERGHVRGEMSERLRLWTEERIVIELALELVHQRGLEYVVQWLRHAAESTGVPSK